MIRLNLVLMPIIWLLERGLARVIGMEVKYE